MNTDSQKNIVKASSTKVDEASVASKAGNENLSKSQISTPVKPVNLKNIEPKAMPVEEEAPPKPTISEAVQNFDPEQVKAKITEEEKSKNDIGLAPREVDFFSPLVQAYSVLFSLKGKQTSCNALNFALGNHVPSPAACQRAAKKLGLNSKIVHKQNLSEISNIVLPCILILKNQQACVIVKRENDVCEVIFSENGLTPTEIPTEVLEEEYSGYCIFASLDPEADKRINSIVKIQSKKWFWDVVIHYLPLYRQVVFASIAINILALVGPLFFMNVYDRVVPNLAYDTLWVLAVGVMAGYVFEFILRVLRSNFTDRANKNINTIVTAKLMQKIMEMRLEDRPDSSGALINHIKEFESLQDFFSAVSLLTVIDFPFLLLFLFVVFFIGGPVVFIPIFAIIILITTILLMQYSIKKYSQLNYQSNVEKNAHLVEMVTGMEAIKMAVAENRMLQIWEKVVSYSAEIAANTKKATTIAVNLATFISHFVSLSLIVWGVYLIGDAKLTMGGLIACNILIGRSMSFVMQIASLMTRYQQAQVSLKVLNHLMDLPSERHSSTNLIDFSDLPHSLELTRVTFSYKNAHLPTIDEISLTIKPGEKVGIIGNMGSGKSTLARLLCGLYVPTQGAVKFGGVDLRRLDMSEFRTRVSFLPQEPLLFHGTLRENIALGSVHIPDQLVLRAAWISGVHEFVQHTPEGYAMQVGEKGQNLSGGQKQAVALARALLHDPDIIILDEPTSNIDGATEARIKARLKKVIGNKTLIINMHRMSLLDLTTRLIVLEDGKVVADGPTKEVYEMLTQKQQNAISKVEKQMPTKTDVIGNSSTEHITLDQNNKSIKTQNPTPIPE